MTNRRPAYEPLDHDSEVHTHDLERFNFFIADMCRMKGHAIHRDLQEGWINEKLNNVWNTK